MKAKHLSPAGKIVLLLLMNAAVILLFLTFQTYGNWEFALELRGRKILAFMLVGAATSFSTITFQTVSHNHFLTPSILGFDSLYVLIQTLLFFSLGTAPEAITSASPLLFFSNVVVMVALSMLLFMLLMRGERQDLYLLLMIGMVLGTLFNSASTFLQVVMDPNEYDKLQGRLFASFGNVNVSLLFVSFLLLGMVAVGLWRLAAKLDVLHLGYDQAVNLGINVRRLRVLLFFLISLGVAVSTALVGPVTFLGFIVANLTYQYMGTFRHRQLFLAGGLISVFLLIFGQFLVEQVFHLNTTLSIVIEFVGGVYFIGKLLRERRG